MSYFVQQRHGISATPNQNIGPFETKADAEKEMARLQVEEEKKPPEDWSFNYVVFDRNKGADEAKVREAANIEPIDGTTAEPPPKPEPKSVPNEREIEMAEREADRAFDEAAKAEAKAAAEAARLADKEARSKEKETAKAEAKAIKELAESEAEREAEDAEAAEAAAKAAVGQPEPEPSVGPEPISVFESAPVAESPEGK